jgi:hypothetical protein
MYKEDGLTRRDIETLIDTFGNQALDFFGALRAATYDAQIRDWMAGVAGGAPGCRQGDGGPDTHKAGMLACLRALHRCMKCCGSYRQPRCRLVARFSALSVLSKCCVWRWQWQWRSCCTECAQSHTAAHRYCNLPCSILLIGGPAALVSAHITSQVPRCMTLTLRA